MGTAQAVNNSKMSKVSKTQRPRSSYHGRGSEDPTKPRAPKPPNTPRRRRSIPKPRRSEKQTLRGERALAASAVPGRDALGVELSPDGAQPLGVLWVLLPVGRRVRAHPLVVEQPHPRCPRRRGRRGSRSRRHRAAERRAAGPEDERGRARRVPCPLRRLASRLATGQVWVWLAGRSPLLSSRSLLASSFGVCHSASVSGRGSHLEVGIAGLSVTIWLARSPELRRRAHGAGDY